MAHRERPADRGVRLARQALGRIGQEIRAARVDRGLSIDAVATAAGISNAEQSRIERARSPRVPLVTLFRSAAVVGLDLAARAYPGPAPLRDSGHVELLADFRRVLPDSLRWANEVPLPAPGDQRAWDAMILGSGWRFGVEAETSPNDAQAVARRIALKLRDGAVDGVLLVIRDGRRTRDFVEAAGDALSGLFPVTSRAATAALRAGKAPAGNALIFVRRRSRTTRQRPTRARHTPGV